MSITTEQLIELAQEAADFENSEFVTTAKWISWANVALPELHRFVTNKYADTYFRTFDFTLSAGQYEVVLPSNFWRLKGLTVDPGTVRRRRVLPFNFAERDGFSTDGWFGRIPVCNDRRYSVLTRTLLQLEPQEHADGNYRLYYTPRPKVLAAVRTIVRTDSDQVLLDSGGVPQWLFANFDLDFTSGVQSPNVGDLLTVSLADNAANNGSRVLTAVTSAVAANSGGSIVAEVFDDDVVATLATCLDTELEEYAEYVWLSMAIKACNKEESFPQAKALRDQRDLIRADLEEAVLTDAGGPQTVIDVNGDGGDVGGGWL